jgi:hypothetical protein
MMSCALGRCCCEPSEARDGLIDQTADLLLMAYIGRDEGGIDTEAAKLGFERPAFGLAAARNNDGGAFPGEGQRGARPMPVRAPVMRMTGVRVDMALPPRILAKRGNPFLPQGHGRERCPFRVEGYLGPVWRL